MITYKSKSGDTKFYLYNGIVCKQYDSFSYKPNKYLKSVYHNFANSFKGYDSSVESESGNEITFYYPEYSVYIQYDPPKSVSITYELYPEYYK